MFKPQQQVHLNFSDGTSLPAVILEEMDPAKMKPLTNYWLVALEVVGGYGMPFGFSGSHITAREAA